MEKKLFIVCLSAWLAACSSTSNPVCHDIDHSAENALDWAATYRGNTAEYPNITLTLHDNQRYVLQTSATPSTGTFTWEQCGSVVKLDNQMRFFVGESHIQPLKQGENRYQANSPYRLEKQMTE